MNNFHQPTNPIERSPFGRLNIPLTANVLENFQQLPLTNPVRSLRFNEPIHMAVSEHLGQSHVSPFNNFQIQGPSVPKNFYFQFFIGLLAAARLEPGNKITAAYTRQYENLLQILVTYGETEMHSHSIFYGKLNVDNSPEIALERELQPLSRHINDLDGTNIKTIESHVYDLVPHRPSSEISDERVGMQMNLRQKKKISTKGDFSPHGANIADFTSQPKRDELSYFFDQIRLTTSEPDVADLNMLARNALLQVPRSETPGNGYIAGYLHGLMFSALPDKYYHRVLTANFPSIRFDPVGMQVYFPATVQRPDEHLLIDSDPYDINRHNGYDVFDQLTNVNHETQITETRLVVSENRFDPLSSTLLQWNIENLAQNLHTDIVFSTPSDAQDLKENIEYYSGVVKKMLNRKSIRCNLHSLEDVRAFLIGTFRAELKKNVKISKSNEKVVDALLVEKEFQFGPAPDLLTTFGVDQNIIQPIDTLITTHKSHHILGMNFQFDNGQISFQPFSMTADEAANRFAFAELPKFNLIPSLEEINRVSDKPLFATSDEETQARQMLHENMRSLFQDINELSIPEESVGPFLAGVFQKSNILRISKADGHWNIETEFLWGQQKFKFYMQLFQSEQVEADGRALILSSKVEKGAFALSYNLGNLEDGMALMALSEEQSYLNTDNMNALCGGRSGRKRRAAGFSYCGLGTEEEPIEHMKNIDKKSEYFEKSPNGKVTDGMTQRLEILNDVAKVCHYAGQALMVRDLVSDVYNGNTLNAVKDSAFLVTTALSPRLSSYLIEKGGTLMANEMKIGGYAMKALGFGVSRAISLYVLYDFVKNTVDYVKNPNDTSAELNMAVDGAFLAIDLITLGIEGLASAGLISGSIAAMANPIGAALGMALIIGLNVYQVVKTIENIQKFVTLNDQELVDESLRAFFHIDPADNVQLLIGEEQANEFLKNQSTNFLTQHRDQFDVLIRKSGIVEGNSIKMDDNAMIDLQNIHYINISRASPKSNEKVNVICPLHEEAREIASPTFWSKVEGFFTEIGHSVKLMYHVVRNAGFETIATDVMEDQLDGQIRGHSYMCHNSFGLQLKNSTPGKAAYFDLGDGHDMISGFIDKSNLFHLGNGRKYIKGGEGNDIFFLEGAHATGYLNGSSGEDTVDMSGMNTPEFVLLSSGNDVVYSNGLNLIDIETVVGRFNIHETVICGCSLRTVRTLGGRRDEPDLIVAKDHDCNYETTLYLDDNTNVSINQVQGNFKHVVNMKQRSEVRLLIAESELFVATHTMIINHSFLFLEKITSTAISDFFTMEFSFWENKNLIVSRSSNESMSIYFNDGCHIQLSSGRIVSASLYTDLSVKKISHLYAKNVRNFGISFTAYSTVDNETVMINAKTDMGSKIIYNSLFTPTNLFVDGCGDSLLLVNATYSDDELLFPHINVHIENCSCSGLIIDFNLIIERIEKLRISKNVNLYARSKGNNLWIIVSGQSTTTSLALESIGQITVIDAFKNQCYKKITVRSHNDFSILSKTTPEKTVDSVLLNSKDLKQQAEEYILNLLEPQTLTYTSNYKFIHLSNLNTEWFNKIFVQAKLGELEFFQFNATSLFITNMRTLVGSDTTNLCSIYVENFYQSNKLRTLTVEAMDSSRSLFGWKEVGAAQSIDKLFNFYVKSTFPLM